MWPDLAAATFGCLSPKTVRDQNQSVASPPDWTFERRLYSETCRIPKWDNSAIADLRSSDRPGQQCAGHLPVRRIGY